MKKQMKKMSLAKETLVNLESAKPVFGGVTQVPRLPQKTADTCYCSGFTCGCSEASCQICVPF